MSPPALRAGPTAPEREVVASNTALKTWLDVGGKALHDGRYGDAEKAYVTAEHVAVPTAPEQYELVKHGHLEVASAYEKAGDFESARKVYGELNRYAVQDGYYLLNTFGRFQDAIDHAKDIEEFSNLVDNPYQAQSRYDSAFLTVQGLRGMHRIREAVQAQQRLVEYLNSRTDTNQTNLLIMAYGNLGDVLESAQNWSDAENAILHANELLAEARNSYPQLVLGFDVWQNQLDYRLLDAYVHEEKNDLGLEKAEEYYRKYAAHDQAGGTVYDYNATDFAFLGLAIAQHTTDSEVIERWKARVPHGFIPNPRQ